MNTGMPFNEMFPSQESKYLLFNFHLRVQKDLIYDFLTSTALGAPRVAILEGVPGIGRRYFLQSAVFDAQRKRPDLHLSLIPIDLDGLEEGPDSLARYLDHFSKKYGKDLNPESMNNISTLIEKRNKPSILDAFEINVLPWLSVSLNELRRWLLWKSEPKDAVKAPVRRDRERFHKFLSWLSQDRRVVLHVIDPAQLTYPLDQWLRYEIKTNQNLFVVFSTTPDEGPTKLTSGFETCTIHFKPYNRSQIIISVQDNFSPNIFPSKLYDVLWRYSLGYPREIAIKLKDLIENEHIFQNSEGIWRLSNDDLNDPGLADEFSVTFISPYEKVIEGLPDKDGAILSKFFCISAMCGAIAPANLILEFLAVLEQEERDRLLDVVDNELIESNPPWLIDYEYTHPSFQGILTYGFTDAICRQVVLKSFSNNEIEILAADFLDFLTKRMPPYTKGAARIYLELAKYSKQLAEYNEYRNLMSWWTEQDYIDDFKHMMIKHIKYGVIKPDALWKGFLKVRDFWSPLRLLALLDAYSSQPDGVPYWNLSIFHFERGWVLREIGRYVEALSDAELAIQTRSSTNQGSFVAPLILRGACKFDLVMYKEAINDFEHALAIGEKIFGPEHRHVATSLSYLASILYDLGDLQTAREYTKRSLRIQEKILGPEHRDVADSLSKLALILHNFGDSQTAREYAKRSLRIREKIFGPEHPAVAHSLDFLALIQHDLGDPQTAREYAERSLRIREKIFGPEHPDVAICLNRISCALDDLGNPQAAREYAERALRIHEKIFGPEHPRVATSLSVLAKILEDLDDRQTAREYAKRSLRIREKIFGPEHFEVAYSLRQLAIILFELGDAQAAREYAEQALRIHEKIFGPEHREVATSLSYLASILYDLGDRQTAREYAKRSLRIQEKIS